MTVADPSEITQPEDVAAAILDRLGLMDTWKLQKLLYYCQAWHLAWRDEPLFNAPIEAWANGPVTRRVYNLHRRQYSVRDLGAGTPDRLSKSALAIVDYVCGRYGELSGRDLSILTHHEDPWVIARESAGVRENEPSTEPVLRAAMAEYYRTDYEAAAQAWYWAADWQAGEQDADDDIDAGDVETYLSDDEFLASL